MKKNHLNTLRNWRFALEWAAFAGVVCLIATFALTAGVFPAPPGLPDTGGLVSRYGLRPVLFLLFCLGGGLSGILFLLSRFPRLYKYPVKITADNVEIQYHIAKIALCAGQLLTLVITCVLMIRVYRQNISAESFEFFRMIAYSCLAGGVIYLIYFLTARHYR